MKIPLYTIDKKEVEKKALPSCFQESIRADLVKRAVLALRANNRQPYGADPSAGMKQISKVSRRRRDYQTSYGHGISRAPRKVMARKGTRFTWVGALAAGTVGGKAAHPPKVEKNWSMKINKKERKKALRSALAATMDKEMVTEIGHILPQGYPFIVESKFESLSKTKEVLAILETLGFGPELARASRKKIRGGRSRLRGRKYKKATGPLLVVSGACPLLKAAKNIPGVAIVDARYLNAETLAPSVKPGRLTLFTDAAIAAIEKGKLFSA